MAHMAMRMADIRERSTARVGTGMAMMPERCQESLLPLLEEACLRIDFLLTTRDTTRATRPALLASHPPIEPLRSSSSSSRLIFYEPFLATVYTRGQF